MQDTNFVGTIRPNRYECRINLTKRRRWFAEDGAGDGGTGTTPTGTQPGTSADNGEPPGNAATDSEKKFTQTDLDKLLGERAKRAEETAVKKLLGDLGIDDVEALKSSVAKQREADDATKTEVEKVTGELTKWKTKAEALETALKAERAARVNDRLEMEVRSIAGSPDFMANDPADVVMWLRSDYSDDLKKAVEAITAEDGTIDLDKLDKKALTALVGKIKESKSYLFGAGKPKTPGSPSNSNGTGTTGKDAEKQIRQQIRKKARL